MRAVIDTDTKTLQIDGNQAVDLYGPAAFALIGDLWLKTSWNQKYSYTFTWMGRPVIQHPDDMVRLQEVIFTLAPDVIVETGVAHGGSLIFYASLFKAMGKAGKIIGVDIEIRPHNRRAIEGHPLFDYITLVEGDSVGPGILKIIKSSIKPTDVVLVILDSDHSYAHVARELEAYHSLVTPNSYIVATDGIMRLVHDAPRGKRDWLVDNPANAAEDFAKTHPEFSIEEPKWLFNESDLAAGVTAWPSGWLKRNAVEGRPA
jgi:cephalosporin hydroxylase